MKNEQNAGMKNGQESKHRYRLNKRKFTIALAILCFIAAAVIVAAHYRGNNEDKKAIASIGPPRSTLPGKSPAIGSEKPLDGKIIVIDAGHGGEDSGAIGINGTYESGLNLSIAFLLKNQLEDKGAETVMTRNDENSLAAIKEKDWEQRGAVITGSGADAVISVHVNSLNDPSKSGPVVMFIAGSVQGKSLADAIQESMNEELSPEVPGITRSEDLIILKYGSQPSVLVECGYISNPQEEEKLNTEEYQLKVAKAICDGVVEYFSSM